MNAKRPKRIQRKRQRGWRMPEGAVYVGRPTRWGNPWKIGELWCYTKDGPQYATAETCVDLFDLYARDPDEPLDVTPLQGKDLCCWCRLIDTHGNYVQCHADVLLSLANNTPLEDVIRENHRRAKGEAVR